MKQPPKISPTGYQVKKDYDYDGVTVADLLSYYIPEWKVLTGRSLRLYFGDTSLNTAFDVYLTVDRKFVVKAILRNGFYEVDKVLDIKSNKHLFFDLLDDCSIIRDNIDVRIKILIRDYLQGKKE